MASAANWTREEHVLAFNLYCKIPFGSIHQRNPRVIELATLLRRTVGAVSLKLSNFARLDPELRKRGIAGMSHGAKGEEAVWKEFYRHPEVLAYESERLLAERRGRTVEESSQIEADDLPRDGREREALVRVRVNQQFFRAAVLSAYDFRCCVTGLDVKELLIASHILSWASSPEHRVNPRNGLCLNALHDRAFDRGLMFVDEGRNIRYSRILKTRFRGNSSDRRALDWMLSFEGQPIQLPQRFFPDAGFLAQHRARCRA